MKKEEILKKKHLYNVRTNVAGEHKSELYRHVDTKYNTNGAMITERLRYM